MDQSIGISSPFSVGVIAFYLSSWPGESAFYLPLRSSPQPEVAATSKSIDFDPGIIDTDHQLISYELDIFYIPFDLQAGSALVEVVIAAMPVVEIDLAIIGIEPAQAHARV